jgi:hypothetical protein
MNRWPATSLTVVATTTDDFLPPIGQPATRALAAIGITRLDQLRQHRAADLLALHGVGPKAIRILEAALAERGWTFLTSAQALPADVQAYIDAVPTSHRAQFDRLHEIIMDELPTAEVVISYQMPLYKVGRRHVGLNAGRPTGVTLTTTSPDHVEPFRRRYPQYPTNKTSIPFRLDDELPEDGIREVIRRATQR